MGLSLEQYHRDVISGADDGSSAALLRGVLGAIEPFYAGVTMMRNWLYDRGTIRAHRVDRPVICVGNITTGGTGKTPVVRWLAEKLAANGHRPAILLRGYKGGDEQKLLQSQLPDAIVHANPNRIQGAGEVLAAESRVDVFILDDGFQHRRIHRDFNLVLIDAGNPLGFNHLLPRGLMRESLSGLKRASAFLLTHADHPQTLLIESALRRFNPNAPIFRCRHVQHGLPDLAGRKVATFCGIGNPAAFESQIASAGADIVAAHRFGDHHHYTQRELLDLQARARRLGAEMCITTEKDWVKISEFPAGPIPIVRAQLSIEFENDHECKLFESITAATLPSPAAPSPVAAAAT